MKKIRTTAIFKVILFTILIALTLAACLPGVPATRVGSQPTLGSTPTIQATEVRPSIREAQVQDVEIQMTDSNPVQINAVVRGNLTESCATLGESQVQYAANAFQITVYAVSPADLDCGLRPCPPRNRTA